MAPYAYVPAGLPGGVIFITWNHRALFPRVCGDSLSIAFAASSRRQIEWTVSRACTSGGRVGCRATGYRAYAYGMLVDRHATINRRAAYYSSGNHGSNAWTCFSIKTPYGRDYVEVGMWESNFMTPSAAMRLVALAKPA